MNSRTPSMRGEPGVPHWKWQRRSALILVPLSLWVLFSLISHIGVSHQQAHDWVAQPLVALFLILFVAALFYHAKLGLQVIIEDYIADASGRQSILKISNMVCWIAMLIGILSIVKIVISG